MGASVSVDNLGENVTNAEEARQSAHLYHRMLDQIAELHLDANVSLKLTHMGLDVDENLAYELVTSLVEKAAAMVPRNFVRVDMEGSPYTQRTLDFVHELHRRPENRGCVGAVIQAYMRRAESDIEKLLDAECGIHLQGRIQRARGNRVSTEVRSGCELCEVDEDLDEERDLPWAGHA